MKNTSFLKTALFCLFVNTGVLSSQNITNESKEVQNLVEKKRNYNKSVRFGYSIQIYYGTEKTAKSKQAKFHILFPKMLTNLVYNNPEWKVQVGDYKTKLDADRANLIFRKEFTGAIVIPLRK